MSIFLFLIAMDIHSAYVAHFVDEQKCDGSPMHLAVYDHDFMAERAYFVENPQGEESVVKVCYRWEYREHLPNLGYLDIFEQEAEHGITIAMEYGQNPEAPLQTELSYGQYPADMQRVHVHSCAVLNAKQYEGYVNVVAPFSAPNVWKVPKNIPLNARPSPNATILADKDSVTVTQYVLRTFEDTEGAFVRARVQYKNLERVVLSWGVEAYSASAYPGTEYAKRVVVAGEKIIKFMR